MALTRILERDDVTNNVRRILDDVRASLDLPFLPSLFKLLANHPEYLKIIWDDLGPVLRSKEFHEATRSLTEYVRVVVLDGGWRFPDQMQLLATQNLSGTELALFSAITGTFSRALPQMLLVSHLLEIGFSGGQRGRISEVTQPSALSSLIEFHVPREKSGGLRVWLIYTDIRRATGSHTVPSVFRMISPFPGYLVSIWLEAKRLMQSDSFKSSVGLIGQRAASLVSELPVHDHRAQVKKLSARSWNEIEETVTTFNRTLPQFALVAMTWHRSFPAFARIATAA